MLHERITPLRKITLPTLRPKSPPSAECCGGAPARNDNACCKLDEEKKAAGAEGCGCNSKEKTAAVCC